MPLVKDGRIAIDAYVRLADDVPVPDGVPVLVTADRLIAAAAALARRDAPVGVVWPNNRRVSELAPYLDRLALVALVFPSFKDGRAYSQARQLREQHGFRGELRATGQVLRDQFLFLARAGFDGFDVTKPADAAAFAEAMDRYSIFYQPVGGRSALRRRLDGGHAVENPGVASDVRETVQTLTARLEDATPRAIIAAAMGAVPRGRLAVVSSFGTESAPLLKLVSEVDRSLPVLFLDTGWLFEETHAYREALVERLGLTDVRIVTPSAGALAANDPRRELWAADPDACCWLRKVLPLAEALRPFDAWINGRKRYHGHARANLATVEHDGRRLKFNPFARMRRDELEQLFEAFDLPRHPLEEAGFASIGCIPCTSARHPREALRAGRWRGGGRTECGIHAAAFAHAARERPALRASDRDGVVPDYAAAVAVDANNAARTEDKGAISSPQLVS